MTSSLLASIVLAFANDVAGVPDAGPRSPEQVVQHQCVLCHGSGVGGAPRLGDRRAWEKRAGAGLDSLVRSATRGRGAMPPRGGLADLSDDELRGAVRYMLQRSGASR